MAKAQVKKAKAPSLHSRAARRATSPSINTDKSLKEVQPPTETINHRPSVLAVHAGAGVSKKSKQGRKSVLSSRARQRHERGLERAEAIVARTAKKVERSKVSAVNIKTRSKVWDEINTKAVGKLGANKFAGLGEDEEDDGFEDVDDDEIVMDDIDETSAASAVVAAAAAAAAARGEVVANLGANKFAGLKEDVDDDGVEMEDVEKVQATAAVVAPAVSAPVISPQDDDDEEIL